MTEETNKKESKKAEKSLEKMTVKELKAVAMEIPRGIAVHDMKKGELIAFIKEARGIKDEEPLKVERKFIEKIRMTKGEIKQTIRRLKKEKKAARETNDKKKCELLRRRISHLKKQTRKLAIV